MNNNLLKILAYRPQGFLTGKTILSLLIAFLVTASEPLFPSPLCMFYVRDRHAQSYVQSQVVYCISTFGSGDLLASYCSAVIRALEQSNSQAVFSGNRSEGACSTVGALAACEGSVRYVGDKPLTISQYYYLNADGAAQQCLKAGGKFTKYK